MGVKPRRSGSAAAAQSRGIAPVDHFPVDVAEEGVDIFGGGGAVIHVETVLVHIEREQRHAGNRTVHMIPRPMVVQRARVEIVDEHAPARSAGKAHPGTAEVGFPAVERAERRAQRVADGTGCLAVAGASQNLVVNVR